MSEHGYATPATDRPLLHRLAARLGIIDSYLDQSGGEVRFTSDETRERLLAAMGHVVDSEEQAGEILRRLRRAQRRRVIAPVRVVRQHSRSLASVRVRVPAFSAECVRWTLSLRTE